MVKSFVTKLSSQNPSRLRGGDGSLELGRRIVGQSEVICATSRAATIQSAVDGPGRLGEKALNNCAKF